VTQAGARDGLRAAMRRAVSTVGIVTTETPDGPRGMTLTAFMSLSMDPPTVAFAVNETASLHGQLGPGDRVCLNLLSSGDDKVARAFAGEVPPEQRIAIGDWDRSLGAPYLKSAAASVVADITAIARHGSHSLYVADVVQVELGPDETALLYGRGRYWNSAQELAGV
jgi:flavin reductase (DIM6/NTAB) family NADH-FMN oxidoreductase RutF